MRNNVISLVANGKRWHCKRLTPIRYIYYQGNACTFLVISDFHHLSSPDHWICVGFLSWPITFLFHKPFLLSSGVQIQFRIHFCVLLLLSFNPSFKSPSLYYFLLLRFPIHLACKFFFRCSSYLLTFFLPLQKLSHIRSSRSAPVLFSSNKNFTISCFVILL